MNTHLYKAKLDSLTDRNLENLVELSTWATSEALPWLWQELAGMTSKKSLTPLSAPHTIRHGLQISISDREKMPFTEPFYVAQLSMLDSEARRYCDLVLSIPSAPGRTLNEFTIYELHGGLNDLLFEGLVMLEQAGHTLLQLPTMFGAWGRRQETPFEIFKGAEQVIYGRFSGLTHADRARWIPVAVLRTALETRIRQAFGIQCYLNPTNKKLKTIDMRKLFEEIDKHLAQIQFAVDFHDIKRVYGWSNPYLHAGWRDFVGVSGYVLQFLRPLFSGHKPATGAAWSINDGIRMPKAVWIAIRTTFEEDGKKEGLELNNADDKTAACVLY